MVRILHITDVHGSRKGLEIINSFAPKVDLIVVAGDVAMDPAFFRRFYSEACELGRVLYVLGNNEHPSFEAPSGCIKLDGRKLEVMGLTFGGLGGSPITPFNTPNEYRDEDAGPILESLGYVDVLVSHTPPYGTGADLSAVGYIGSKAVREYMERYRPRAILSGHVHEASFAGPVEGVIVVNPGMARLGKYALLEINSSVSYEIGELK